MPLIDTMNQNIEKNRPMDGLPPFLQQLKDKGDGFKVPEGYFEQLENAVLTRLKVAGNLRQPISKSPFLTQKFRVSIGPRAAVSLAAALALVLTAIWFVKPKWSPPPKGGDRCAALALLTEDDIASYLLENAYELDPSQLALLQSEENQPLHKERTDKKTPQQPSTTELQPEDLDAILDYMTSEELEEIL